MFSILFYSRLPILPIRHIGELLVNEPFEFGVGKPEFYAVQATLLFIGFVEFILLGLEAITLTLSAFVEMGVMRLLIYDYSTAS